MKQERSATDQSDKRAAQIRAATARYKRRHPERIKAYSRSAAAKAARNRWRKKAKAVVRAALYRWRQKYPNRYRAVQRRFRASEQGRRSQERWNLELPASAPDSLVKGFRLLRALKQENRKWTSTN